MTELFYSSGSGTTDKLTFSSLQIHFALILQGKIYFTWIIMRRSEISKAYLIPEFTDFRKIIMIYAL